MYLLDTMTATSSLMFWQVGNLRLSYLLFDNTLAIRKIICAIPQSISSHWTFFRSKARQCPVSVFSLPVRKPSPHVEVNYHQK